MKKLNLLIGTFALAATIVSCSSDEVVVHQDNAPGITNQSIGFSPLSRAVSRSNVLSQTSDMSSFRVMGFWVAAPDAKMYIQGAEKDYTGAVPTAGSPYEGFGTYTSNGQTGIEIVQRNGSAWDYKNSSEIQYWPFSATKDGDNITGYNCAALNFKAVTPASTPLDLTGSTFTYTTPAVASMEDICYAKAGNQTNQVVNLAFNHLFSQIVFNAKRPENYEVQIKEIEIGGVKTKGNYTDLTSTPFNVTIANDASVQKFQGFTTASEYIEVGINADGKTVQITPEKSELLLLPQQITKWTKGTGDEAKPGTSKNGTLKIVYRARISGATTWATAAEDGSTTYATVYYPLETNWESGKKYIYALLFGGVSDDDGNGSGGDPIGDDPDEGPFDEDGNIKAQAIPITFTASVVDWTPANVDVTF